VLQRSYSRGREEKADRFGLELVFRVYGETEGVDRLFEILEKSDATPRWAYMFATHPAPTARIAELKKQAAELVQEQREK
jgi:predicted Zn-dependent protease